MTTDETRAALERRLTTITVALRRHTVAGILHGSQLDHPSLDRDIDLLLLTDGDDNDHIFRTVARLQIELSQPVHAVLLTNTDLKSNLHFREWIEKGRPLWQMHPVDA